MKSIINYLQWAVIFFMIILVVGQYAIANDLGMRGKDLTQVESNILKMREENHKLLKEYSTLTSYDQIASKAKEMGFDAPSNTLIIPQVQSVALR